jgi:hypothetical protein
MTASKTEVKASELLVFAIDEIGYGFSARDVVELIMADAISPLPQSGGGGRLQKRTGLVLPETRLDDVTALVAKAAQSAKISPAEYAKHLTCDAARAQYGPWSRRTADENFCHSYFEQKDSQSDIDGGQKR